LCRDDIADGPSIWASNVAGPAVAGDVMNRAGDAQPVGFQLRIERIGQASGFKVRADRRGDVRQVGEVVAVLPGVGGRVLRDDRAGRLKALDREIKRFLCLLLHQPLLKVHQAFHCFRRQALLDGDGEQARHRLKVDRGGRQFASGRVASGVASGSKIVCVIRRSFA
jgi:hypothetical protein